MKTGYKHMRCGLLGEKLSHSFSPQIHGELADYSYSLIEKAPEEVGDFVKSGALDAYNVTVPYKKAVMPFLDDISDEALAIGAVNTVVVDKDGKKHGYNTDYFGFCYMLDSSAIDVCGKKALVIGTGGAAATVIAVLRDRRASSVVEVSIENNNKAFLSNHADAQIIVNATPVGMYPHNGTSPISLSDFPMCEGVLDVIYNPSLTALLLDAEEKGIPHANGLSMLVAQAVKAFELFTGDCAEKDSCKRITSIIESQTKNIILIGMPGCGKSSVGRLLAEKLGRPFYDADDVFAESFGISPAEVITSQGEERFRQMEHEIAKKLGRMSGTVISCGGGVVTRDFNYRPLHQNGTLIFLERSLEKLSKKGRPLSQTKPISTLYNERIDAYRRFSDFTVHSTEIQEKTAALMLDTLFGNIGGN